MAAPGEMPEMESEETAEAAGETEFCIRVGEGGELTVYGTGDAEMPEQPAADIGQALKLVLDGYKSLTVTGEDEAFDAGFNGGQKAAMPMMGRGQ